MIKNMIGNFSIKFKFIIGIITILIIAMFSLSIVFIKKSEHQMIQGLKAKAELLNKNFSIVSARAIQEYSFTNLQHLIDEVAKKDREIKVFLVTNADGTIIASSQDTLFPQLTQIQDKKILHRLEKKEDGLYMDKHWKVLESVRVIFDPSYSSLMNIDASSLKQNPMGFIYIMLDMTFLEASISKLWAYSILLTLVVMGGGIIAAYGFGSSMSGPIGSLAKEVRTIASGDLNKSIQSKRKDEIGQLIWDVDKMRVAIKDLTENLEAKVEERTTQLQEANEKIEAAMQELWGEMHLAKKIQTMLLPVRPQLPGYDISASLEPADEVGGDYYDVISVQGYDWIIIGDVSGHGVPAGLIMMMAQTAIHTALYENPDMATSQLMHVVNMTISANIRRLEESKYMTMTVLAAIRDGEFSFAGLHQDILVWRANTGKIEKIQTRGMWLGIEPDISKMLAVDNLKLNLGDCMTLFTDGVTEARDKEGNMFGSASLIRVIETCGSQSAADIHQGIVDALAGYEKKDDVTLFVMKRML